MAWSSETPSYCGWNERHVKNTKEKMEVHYYLERKDGIADLAVIGRLKNSKRMSFRYALKKNRSVLKKLNSKDDVALWLDSIVSGEIPHVADVPATVMTEKDAGGFNMSTFMNRKFQEPIQQIKTFSWMGFSWTCRKRRKHYQSYLRNGVRISVNDFVYVLAEQHKRLVAYIEDLYEDSKGKKMVVVRWFHKTEEVGSVLSDDDNDREIFFSLNRQDISIECIDYLATVLSPQHYEKFLKVPMHVQTVAFFCQKLYGDDGLKPYDITQLEGYWRQEMLRYLNVSILKSFEGAQAPGTDPGLKAPLVGCVGIRSRKRRRPSPVGTLNVSYAGDMKGDCKSSPDSVLAVTDASIFKGDEDGSSHHIKKGSLIEVLSEDSGIRGCWFKALVLKKHKDKVKVQYQDIQDADDESKKLLKTTESRLSDSNRSSHTKKMVTATASTPFSLSSSVVFTRRRNFKRFPVCASLSPEVSPLLRAAHHTVDNYVKSGMIIGLGSGEASDFAIRYLGQQLGSGSLHNVVGVPMSARSASEAAKYGIPLEYYRDGVQIDFAFHDADAVEENTLIAVIGRRRSSQEDDYILKQKSIVKVADEAVFMIKEEQYKAGLEGSIPVLVQSLNWLAIAEEIDDLYLGDAEVWRRASVENEGPLGGDFPIVTSDGHNILDVIFTTPIRSLADLATSLDKIDGVVDHGLIIKTRCTVVIAEETVVRSVTLQTSALEGGVRTYGQTLQK